MKLKMILCTFALTTLILSGCSQNDTGNAENSLLPDSTTPSTPTEMSQSTDNLASQLPPINNVGGAMIADEAEALAPSHAEPDADYNTEYFTPSSDTNTQTITADTAKEIALAKVPGATANHIREFKSDYDNGKLQYEGKIYFEQTEYEFEIDGYSGNILEWDVEPIYEGAS